MHFRNRGSRSLVPLAVPLLVVIAGGAQAAPVVHTPNQARAAAYLKTVCADLAATAVGTSAPPPSSAQLADLTQRCQFFEGANSAPAALGTAYTAVMGQQINAIGPQTKKFGSLQQDNLAARLAELRRGARGASFSGLEVTDADGNVLANGGSQLSDYLPGGASGDAEQGWLDGRLGVFVNGSLKGGSKRVSKNSFAFNLSDNSVTVGADYRITNHIVAGAAVGSGKTTTDFANSFGHLDITATGVSVFASLYGTRYYVDAVAGYGRPHLQTDRHIAYSESASIIDQDATGSTHLRDVWTGISAGSPLNYRAFTLTPEVSLNYHEIRLDGFTESMSAPAAAGSGLALAFGDAVVPSLQGRAGLRAAYTFSGSWGVFEPNLHATFIREMRSHPDDFTARLAYAPQAAGLFYIGTDPPEGHYFGGGGGVNFQLAHGISGFVDYEQLKVLKTIKSHELSLGLRYQFGI
jgi:uncharacterized protein YhjY with autotransporter beta-barrel domain